MADREFKVLITGDASGLQGSSKEGGAGGYAVASAVGGPVNSTTATLTVNSGGGGGSTYTKTYGHRTFGSGTH